ncbi:hypothetical protein G6F46_002732 [Rhizopus delemar]|uniref:Uncharacterized protein n=2 Tax=Rhizopus TaxID=4842 RepID=A0A9P6YSB2_9FUNG|nr:hypothetical protein G6F43_001257 [Rhizopus delemar]KAG1549864.1 hypothetical protein G6F51_002792 [Rhizopus arrhizus]KAG1444865.1 hypothetical protein G6F55_012176 [Rhizopus delemar]KAG1495988.1 hypothetical protein G6F53_012268 [Rhizopus delemar]KAG1502812.1 hypothetical protein G6F54_002106 [Rhizopus delemar]
MFDIPNKFIVSSRLSTLDSKEILYILQLAHSNWEEQNLSKRMRRYPKTPIICIGISNPQELERVIHDDIPIIHIQENCIALQRVQERQDRYQNYINNLLWVGTSSLWGVVGYNIKRIKSFRGTQWKMVISGGVVCLSMWTWYIILRMKRHYKFLKDDGHAFLMRRDVLRSRRNAVMQLLIPFWLFAGYSIEEFNKV